MFLIHIFCIFFLRSRFTRRSIGYVETMSKRRKSGQPEGMQSAKAARAAKGGPEATIVQEVVKQLAPTIVQTVREAMEPAANLPDPEPEVQMPGMVAGAACDIDAHVSIGIKAKICNGEYVDLSTLLHSPFASNDNGSTLSVVEGQIMIKPRSKLPKILDIEKWTDAFLIFINIYVGAHPEKVKDLLKYMSTVRLGAKRYGGIGWKLYDEQYRLRQAQNPTNSWADIDQELWMLYMFYSPPMQRPLNNRQLPNLCFNYNNGRCLNRACQFTHKCIKCTGFHPAVSCFTGSVSRQGTGRGRSFRVTPDSSSGQTGRPVGTMPRENAFKR